MNEKKSLPAIIIVVIVVALLIAWELSDLISIINWIYFSESSNIVFKLVATLFLLFGIVQLVKYIVIHIVDKQ